MKTSSWYPSNWSLGPIQSRSWCFAEGKKSLSSPGIEQRFSSRHPGTPLCPESHPLCVDLRICRGVWVSRAEVPIVCVVLEPVIAIMWPCLCVAVVGVREDPFLYVLGRTADTGAVFTILPPLAPPYVHIFSLASSARTPSACSSPDVRDRTGRFRNKRKWKFLQRVSWSR
jgi:hypothetical protein